MEFTPWSGRNWGTPPTGCGQIQPKKTARECWRCSKEMGPAIGGVDVHIDRSVTLPAMVGSIARVAGIDINVDLIDTM